MRRLIILTYFMLMFGFGSYAGSWLKPKKAGYAQLSYTWLKYNQLINAYDDPYDLKREVQDFTLQLYGEYGIEDNINILLILPYKILATGNTIYPAENDPSPGDTLVPGRMNAFSNPIIGLKFPLIRKGYVLSAQVNYSPPVYTYDEASGLRSGFDCSMVSPSIMIGKGWSRSYFNTEAGYIYKSNNYADFFRANIEYGLRFNWKKQTTWIAVVLDAMLTVSDPGFDNGNALQTGLYIDGSEYISPGFKVSQSVKGGFSFELGVNGAVYSTWGGKNPTVSAGLSYQWE